MPYKGPTMDRLEKCVVWMTNLGEELTEEDVGFQNARVALERYNADGPNGNARDVYDAMWKLQKEEQQYFVTRYLEKNRALLRGWHKQVSNYRVGDQVIGRGYQGVVKCVQGHPDKVAKIYTTRHQLAHDSYTTLQFKLDIRASDHGFGPKVYEISYDGGRVMDISDPSTIPQFKRGRRFVVVMELLQNTPEGELLDHYVGVVNVWRIQRDHGLLNVDGFYGYSPFHRAMVTADFGAVEKPKNDGEFVRDLVDYFECSETRVREHIARRYLAEFPNEPFSQNILKPVLNELGP